MPRRKAPPRLYLDRTRDAWVIRDGQKFIRTGCERGYVEEAEGQLAAYIGEKYTPPKTNAPTVREVLVAYGNEIVPHRASRRNIAYNIGSLLKWWGDKKATEVNSRTCRAYADTKTSAAAGADLKVLRAALRHWQREHQSLQFSVWTPTVNAPRDRWLSRSEVARLLWAARHTQHVKRIILLGVYTGSRPGIILRLQWDQIDISAGVMARNRPGEATHAKKRAPPVRLGRRILSHLRRWRRLDAAGAGTVSFLCHFEGRQIQEPHTAWRRIVKKSGLPGRITPHTLRHTRATWLMQAGVSPWEAAGHLGMTIKTLEATYAHHHPSWQKNAAEV